MRLLSVFAFRTARLAGTLLALALAGCAPQMRTLSSYQGPALPRPDGVLVQDFAVTPQEVKLDRGISARAMQAVQDTPRSDLEAGVGRKVAQTISESVVKELQAKGIAARRADGGGPPADRNAVLVEGQILSIDEGNRTRRNVIGLGAGRSDVEADIQVLYQGAGQGAGGRPVLLISEEGVSRSGDKPGAAETMGIGALGGHLATSAAAGAGMDAVSETWGATVESDAARMGREIADRIVQEYRRQGWQ